MENKIHKVTAIYIIYIYIIYSESVLELFLMNIQAFIIHFLTIYHHAYTVKKHIFQIPMLLAAY